MKKAISFFAFLLFTQLSYCQYINFNEGFTNKKTYYEEIPFEYVNDKIIVPVRIKEKSYRFLFDTGATSIVSNEVMDEVKPTIIDKTVVTDASGRADTLAVVSLSNLHLGEVVFHHTPTLVYDLRASEIFSCFDIYGFIGSNMLRNSVVQIDAKAQVLRITHHPRKLNIKKKAGLPMKLKGNISAPNFVIKLNGQGKQVEEEIMFDTGMDGLFDLSVMTYEKLQDQNLLIHLSFSQGASSLSLFGDAPERSQHRVFVPSIKIGDFELTNVVTTTVVGSKSRIGAELLQYGLVTLDYRNKRFHFSPFKPKVDAGKKLLGFSPTIKENKLVVGMVWDEDLKELIGYGDEILEINGKPFASISICDLFSDNSIFKNEEFFEIHIRTTKGEDVKLELQKKFYTP